MKFSDTAHGKVILIGEHSVVYGYDALALPIKSLHITVTAEKTSGDSWMDTQYYHGPFYQAPSNYDGLKYVLNTMLDQANQDLPIKLTYTGAIPMERGLGSSATVALATCRALNQLLALNLSPEKIMLITNHAEMINHGKASGLDAATVNSDYLVYFNRQTGPSVLANNKLGAALVIMDTGDLGNTKEAVSLVKKRYDQSATVKKEMAELGKLVPTVKNSWQKHDLAAVAACFNQAQEILADFGVSTAKIDQIIKLARTNGAEAAKLSGGGLGGIVIALCANLQQAKKVAQACQKQLANYWIEEI